MSTQSPSSIEQTSAVLMRLVRQLTAFLEIEEIATKRDQTLYHGFSPLNQLTLDLQILIKMLIKRMQEAQKAFQKQLQKLEEKLRKHAKSQCEMKLYCDYLQDQLKTAQKQRAELQSQKNILEINFNKQIQTLKTQFSHGTGSKLNQIDKCLDTARVSTKPNDALTKIKIKLMNLANSQVQEPHSCINTLRRSLPIAVEELRPLSQPSSQRNSHSTEKLSTKSRSKVKIVPKQQRKSKKNLQIELKVSSTCKHSKSKPKLKKNG